MLLLLLLLMITMMMLRSVTIIGLYGPGTRRPGPARSAREYSGDIKLCINEFYGLAGRHSLALTARCGSSEAFLYAGGARP